MALSAEDKIAIMELAARYNQAIDGGEAEPVGVRVRLHRGHLADGDQPLVPVAADALDHLDL